MNRHPHALSARPPGVVDSTIAESWMKHRFFGRKGGLSTGPYASLNPHFGNGDDPVTVAQNRDLIFRDLGVTEDQTFIARQAHGTAARVIEAGERPPLRDPCDALVTAVPGVAVGVVSADCAPVLLVCPQARVIGVAHAGWRGAVAGVLENTVRAMERTGARQIVGSIGPCIGPASYEVRDDFRNSVLSADPDARRFFLSPDVPPSNEPVQRAFCFDLPAYVAERLRRCGVRAAWVGADTLRDAEAWHSRRFNLARGQAAFGANLLIATIVGGA